MSTIFAPTAMQETIETTLASFRAPATVVSVERGPRLTRYALRPAPGVRVGSIVRLAPDLALALAAQAVRIAPIPGSSFLGLDVSHPEPSPVLLTDLLATMAFIRAEAHLPLALGVDSVGQPVIIDLASLPHLLIAGTTGAGKSCAIQSLLGSLVARHTPQTLRVFLCDPKQVELCVWSRLPHLLAPILTDVARVPGMLRWLLGEMQRRYTLFSRVGTRDLARYNATQRDSRATLPSLVLIIDEMADLMLQAKTVVEDAVKRLAALGRATGIHLVVATQRPSVDVLTGVIKANFPARLAFATRTAIDSRTILGQSGAEQLLGQGDALYLAPDAPALRLQGSYLSDADIVALTR